MKVMRLFRFFSLGGLAAGAIVFGAKSCSHGCKGDLPPATEVRLSKGAGGVGFLPLLVMQQERLIEKHATKNGMPELKVTWLPVGGPTVVNNALLSGHIDFVAAGPPAFLILWANSECEVRGVSAITSLPMYLNARDARLQTLDDFNDRDRIAVTGTNTSIPAVIMQKYAVGKHGLSKAKLFDRLTITMTHAEGLNTLLSGSKTISAHFTSPPFHQRELQDPNVHTVINSSQIMNGSTTFNMLSTTTAFYKKNPKVVAAVLAALEQANRMIRDDKRWAAEILFNETPNSKFTKAQLLDAISDPAVKFTIVPENIMEYGEFMHKVGTLEKKPSNWTDMFFPEIYKVYGAQGS